MQKQYIYLLFSIASFGGVYFQWYLRKNLVKDNLEDGDDLFFLSKIVGNAILGIFSFLLFLKDFL